MGIKLSQIEGTLFPAGDERTIKVGDDGELHVTMQRGYYSRRTELLHKRIAAALNGQANPDTELGRDLVAATLAAVVSWDLEDEKGRVYSLTQAGIETVPSAVLLFIWGSLVVPETPQTAATE